MAYHGSLTGCITALGDIWARSKPHYLAVIHHPRAKYYSVATDEDLANPQYKPEYGDQRLVLRCTLAELRSIMTTNQTNLFPEDSHA
jgi:hypothetical protein